MVTGTRGIPGVMGGVETHCEELFPRLAERGWDVTVVRRSNYVEDGLKEWKGVRLVTLPSPKKKSFEAIIHTFRAINEARRLGADILHIHAIGPALLVPYADVIRNLISRKYGRTSHVHLIYNGVSRPEVCDFPEYFEELGIEKGKYILGMCRFVPEKNLHHLVQAFARMKNARGIKLVLAGDTDFEDDYSRSLKEAAKANGVVLTGFVKGRKLHSLLTHCRCYCLPSSHEGLPIALLEAMSYGVEVVVSDIPANLEVGLDRDCYFPVGNIDALVQKLDKIAALPLKQTDYDMSKYDWNRIATQVAEVYLTLTTGNSGTRP